MISLLICGVLCQDRGNSRYVPSPADEDYDDAPPVNAPPPPPRRTQTRRGRPLPTRGQQHEETPHGPPSNTRSLPSHNTHPEQNLPESFPVERGPPRRPTAQRSPQHSRQRYGPEEQQSDHKSHHAPLEDHAEVSTPPSRTSRRRRPSKRPRNENFADGDNIGVDKPRTRDHQSTRSPARLLDDDVPRSHRYQAGDDAFPGGDMQRLPRPAPKPDQESKRSRDKPRHSPRPQPHTRYTPPIEDGDRPTQRLPVRRPVLEPQQPPVHRLPPDEHEEPPRGLPDTYVPGAPDVHSAGPQDRPFPREPGPPQITSGISDNSFESPDESLHNLPPRPNPESDISQLHRAPYVHEDDSGIPPDFKESAVRKEQLDNNRDYPRGSRAHQQGNPAIESPPPRSDFPLKDNTIPRTADRGRNRNAQPQRAAPPGINRRNPSFHQRDSAESYEDPVLKPNTDQSLRETTGRRIHAPSEAEVRLPLNRQPLIAPDFAVKEEEPKVVSYHYQHNPQAPQVPFTVPNKDFEAPHNEDFHGPSDRLPDAGNSDRQPEFPPNADGPPFNPSNLDVPPRLETPGVEFADEIAKLEASAEAEVDRHINRPPRNHPSPSNRLPVESAEEDVTHAFPPPRSPHDSRTSVRPPQAPRDVRPPQGVRNTRVRQDSLPQDPRDHISSPDSRDSRSPQRIRDSSLPRGVRNSRAPQNLRDSPQYRETASSRSRYTKEDHPDAELHSQRNHRGGSRYTPESVEEIDYAPRRNSAPQREIPERTRTEHRSRPQHEGDSRRSPPYSRSSSRDPDEVLAPQSQQNSPRNRQRQSYPQETEARNSENRRPHYNAPPPRDRPRPIERRDPEPAASKSNFKCPESFGFFADSRQCDKYYECRNGTAIESLCTDGLAFNEVSAPKFLRCDSLRDVDCSSRPELQPPQPTKNCPRRFGLYPHETDCTRFWNCVDGASTEVHCPPGLVYSDTKATCDWADLVENTCKSEDLLGFTCPEATSAELQDGVYSRYPHPNDCRLHFTCIKGVDGTRRPRMLSCNDGTVFDPQKGQCTRAENVPGCENYYGAPARSTKPQQKPPSSEEAEELEPRVTRRRRPNKRTRARAEDRYYETKQN